MMTLIMLVSSLALVMTSVPGDADRLNASSGVPMRGADAGSRLAYIRWRVWLLTHPVLVHKVPPKPRLNTDTRHYIHNDIWVHVESGDDYHHHRESSVNNTTNNDNNNNSNNDDNNNNNNSSSNTTTTNNTTNTDDSNNSNDDINYCRSRPVVTVEIDPSSIFNVDAAHQTFRMSLKIKITWQDEELALDTSLIEEFTGGDASLLPKVVSVPLKALWRPGLILVEGVSLLFLLDDDALDAEVGPRGDVTVLMPSIITQTCRFDMARYPFDQHDCTFSVLEPYGNVHVAPTGAPWSPSFSQEWSVAGEWDLLGVRSQALVTAVTGVHYTRFVLTIKRKVTFYSIVIIFPMVMTSYLNVLVFLLPPELGDKASFVVTLSISLSVFTSFFNADMPRGLTSLPRIFVLLVFVFGESFLCLVLSLVVLRKRKLELVAMEEAGKAEAEMKVNTPSTSSSSSSSSAPGMRKGLESEITFGSFSPSTSKEFETEVITPGSFSTPSRMRKGLGSSSSPTSDVSSSGEKEQRKGNVDRREKSVWQMSARQLDLVFFVIVLVANTVGMVVILAPLL